jgi:HSP20 family molecular chaperone IbpA
LKSARRLQIVLIEKSADFNQGVLTLHLPETEGVKPRRITVKGE